MNITVAVNIYIFLLSHKKADVKSPSQACCNVQKKSSDM